ALAAWLGGRAGEAELPSIQAVPRTGPLPLSFAQERLWFLDQLAPGSSVYNLPIAIRLRGQLDLAALPASLAQIVRRHEARRTTCAAAAGRPRQVVAPPASALAPPRVDLGQLPETVRAAEVERLARAEALRPFDLAQGPLLRAGLLRLGTTEHVALLTMHH